MTVKPKIIALTPIKSLILSVVAISIALCVSTRGANYFDGEFVQRSIDLDLDIIVLYRHELSSIE